MSDTAGIIYFDEQPFPLDWSEVTVEHEHALRLDLGVSVAGLGLAIVAGNDGALEQVAVKMLSLMQSDEPADHRWLLRHVNPAAEVEVVGFGQEATASA